MCLAGVDSDGRTWRPEPDNRQGVTRSDLETATDEVIRTGSVIEFYGKPKDSIEPPHVEDIVYEGKMRFIGHADESTWVAAMRATRFTSVAAVFDGLIERDRFVPPGSKTRSLGTVMPKPQSVECSITDASKPTVRMTFTDSSGTQFTDWVVNDLAFIDYVADRLSTGDGQLAVLSEVNHHLQAITGLLLRVGLARPWSRSGPEQCWAQITGIHSPRPPKMT